MSLYPTTKMENGSSLVLISSNKSRGKPGTPSHRLMTFGWLSDGKLRTYPTGTSAFLSGFLMTETDSWSAAKKVLHIGVAAQKALYCWTQDRFGKSAMSIFRDTVGYKTIPPAKWLALN